MHAPYDDKRRAFASSVGEFDEGLVIGWHWSERDNEYNADMVVVAAIEQAVKREKDFFAWQSQLDDEEEWWPLGRPWDGF